MAIEDAPVRLKVEVEERVYEYLRRTRPDGDQYSLDEGVTWHATLVDALRARPKLEPERQGEEFQAFSLALLQEIQTLKPGESLRIVRDDRLLAVVKEAVVPGLTTPVSTFGDVEIKLEQPKRG